MAFALDYSEFSNPLGPCAVGIARNLGMALRHVRVDREYQHALDEARDRATRFDIVNVKKSSITGATRSP